MTYPLLDNQVTILTPEKLGSDRNPISIDFKTLWRVAHPEGVEPPTS